MHDRPDLTPLAAVAREVAAEWGVTLGPTFTLARYSYVAAGRGELSFLRWQIGRACSTPRPPTAGECLVARSQRHASPRQDRGRPPLRCAKRRGVVAGVEL